MTQRLFDGHCDTILRCYLDGGPLRDRAGQLNLCRTRVFPRYAQFFALFGSAEDTPGLELWEVLRAQYALFRWEMDRNADLIAFCRGAGEAEAAFASGRSAAFLSVEGAEMLNCDLGKLEEAHRMGVRAVNLTWNHANALSGSNAEAPERGLSALGRDFVRRMEALGMLVDVSHLSDPGFWDVAACARGPLFASHSNARAVYSDQRNLTNSQFTAIIESDGVAGLNMYAPFLGEDPDLDTVVAHLEHFLALGGARHVSIGGDWDGASRLPRGMDGVWDMEKLAERLLRRNYSEPLIDAVFYTNLMRVVTKICIT